MFYDIFNLSYIDFEKAFDTISHARLWEVLLEQGVDAGYISILKKLYHNQCATVRVETVSRHFALHRGVKQGDPLSALLFIAVMEACFRKLKKKWSTESRQREGLPLGIQVESAEATLRNLRFADDVILFASCRDDIAQMIQDLADQAAVYGLNVNFSKTKVFANTVAGSMQQAVVVRGHSLPILPPSASEKYLGCCICLENLYDKEVRCRISSAWAGFMKFKAELCN